jgi:hypothetical protein
MNDEQRFVAAHGIPGATPEKIREWLATNGRKARALKGK